MDFKQFREKFSKSYFNIEELRLFFANEYNYHLRYRKKTNKVIKLIKGWYLFSDTSYNQNLRFELANKIYSPSYISLESSLSYHWVIPESVRVTTSITTKRTRELKTSKWLFLYQTVKPELFHGYMVKTISVDNISYSIASLAKTIVDYLYLHHEIKTKEDFAELRWNRELLDEQLSSRQLLDIAEKYTDKATLRRVNLLLNYIND